MKKGLAAALSVLVLAVSISAPSFAAIKAGSPCSKRNAIGISAGYKYTCIKSGTRLVWSKGIKSASPAPKISPLPSSTPIPLPVATQTPAPTTSPSPTALPTPERRQARAGDVCAVVGETIENSDGYLECRDVARSERKYFQLSKTVVDLPLQNSPVSFTKCRVPDMRTDSNRSPWEYASTYPRKWIPLDKNEINVVYIPFDFPDHPGTGDPRDLYRNDFTKMKEWVKWYSNGKKKIEITTFDKWIRSSRPSTDYVPHFWHGNLNMKIGVEMILKDVENQLDLSKIDVIQLIFPKDMKTIKEQSGGRWEIATNKGRLTFNMYTTGFQSFTQRGEIWFNIIHEMLHQTWGLQQHAPAFPTFLSINTGTPGPGQSLITWDAMILDWTNPEDLWCTDLTNLKSSEVTLVPLEREQEGARAAMVNLAPSRTLVIESHRRDKWGNFNPGTYGVTAYIVDTRFPTDRSGEGTPKDDLKGTSYTRVANYIEFPLNHGQYIAEWWDWLTGDSYGISPRFTMNYFLYEGESFTFENVKVTLVQSGDNDTIRIEKI